METLEILESIRAEEASVARLFGSEGQGVRHGTKSPEYMKKLVEAAEFVAEIMSGKRPAYQLREVMTTSDFPYLFGDVLDRALLAAYREAPATYRNYVKTPSVRDFRQVKRFSVYGADAVLSQVDENGEYPSGAMHENAPYTYNVMKYGRVMPFSWESIINDDLGAFSDMPERLGRAARRSEEKFATGLFVDANGPHASFYTGGNANIVTGNPALSIPGLQTAMAVLGAMVDEQGEPIVIETVELVVGPSLEITALNILNAIQLELAEGGGSSNQKLIAQNWMKTRMNLSKNAYIPIVASSSHGTTSWFLFTNPNSGRQALEVGFLRGHEEPEVFMKAPNASRVGGGGEDALNGDFETDSVQYKVRHVFGGARMSPKCTVGSNGSGA